MSLAPPSPHAPYALYTTHLTGGGVGRSLLELATGLVQQGHAVDLVVARSGGHLERVLPAGVRLVHLGRSKPLQGRWLAMRAVPRSLLWRPVLARLGTRPEVGRLGALVRYLRQRRPRAIFAAKTYANLTAIWARSLSGIPCRLVISERTALSQEIATEATAAWRHLLPLLATSYPHADVISAVSQGVADDLERLAHLPAGRVVALPNPLISPDTMAMAEASPNHPWFDGTTPVILAAGRLVPQKDFATLLRAFALLHHQGLPHRLVIAGEGKERPALLGMIESLGLAGWVDLPGFVDNPLALMARAALFVLSSRFEGLPGVLIQALSCGCPVVATDCPSGPREILLDGRLGPLVPVGDHEALARAMAATLAQPPDRSMLKDRAQDFSRDVVARRTAALLDGRSPEVVVSQTPSKTAS